MDANVVVDKTLDFAVRIVRMYQYLCSEKKEYVMSKQLLRCGTSIGANVAEAQRGQSRADFRAKMNIALKEASETQYWLKLLLRTDYIDQHAFNSIHADLEEITSIIAAICKSSQ